MPAYAAVALETTGLRAYDKIVRLAVTHVAPDGTVTAQYDTAVNPRQLKPAPSELADAPDFQQIAAWVAELIDGRVLVVHSSVAARSLRQEFSRLPGNPGRVVENYIETLAVTRARFPDAPPRLSLLLETLGLRTPGTNSGHNAAAHARDIATLLAELLRQDPALADSTPPVDASGIASLNLPEISETTTRYPRVASPDAQPEEIDFAHTLEDGHLLAHSPLSDERQVQLKHLFIRRLIFLSLVSGGPRAEDFRVIREAAAHVGVDTTVIDEGLRPLDPSVAASLHFGPGSRVALGSTLTVPGFVWSQFAIDAGMEISPITHHPDAVITADPSVDAELIKRADLDNIPVIDEFTCARLFGHAPPSTGVSFLEEVRDVDGAASFSDLAYGGFGNGARGDALYGHDAPLPTVEGENLTALSIFPWVGHDVAAGNELLADNGEIDPVAVIDAWTREHTSTPLKEISPYLPDNYRPAPARRPQTPVSRWVHRFREPLSASADDLKALPGVGDECFVELMSTIIEDAIDAYRTHSDTAQHSGANPASLASQATSPVEILSSFFHNHDEREQTVMRERIAARKPVSFSALGAALNLTRERVRQIKLSVLAELRELVTFSPIADLVSGIHEHAHPVASVESLLLSYPELSTVVPGWDAPLIRILDGISDDFLIESGWICFPDLSSAMRDTSELIASITNPEGVVALGQLAATIPLNRVTLIDWLTTCGFEVIDTNFRDGWAHTGEFVLTGPPTLAARAASLLSLAERGVSIAEIHDLVGQGRNLRSTTDALATSDEIVRLGKDSWGLKRWGFEEFTSIRDAARRRVEAALAKGRTGVRMTELAKDLAESFGVSESSVRSLAATGELEIIAGEVRPRVNLPRNPATPESSRGLYVRDGRWQLLVEVTADHLRGSGTPVPPAVTALLKVPYNKKITLENEAGPVTVAWNGSTHTIGSVRRQLDAMNAVAGDRVWFDVQHGTTLTISMCTVNMDAPDGATPVELLAHRIGLDLSKLSAEHVNQHVMAAFGLDENSTLADLIARLKQRDDRDLLAILEHAS